MSSPRKSPSKSKKAKKGKKKAPKQEEFSLDKLPFCMPNFTRCRTKIDETSTSATILADFGQRFSVDAESVITMELTGFKFERIIEDHERFYPIYMHWTGGDDPGSVMCHVKQDKKYVKFEYFRYSKNVFPYYMIALDDNDLKNSTKTSLVARYAKLQHMLLYTANVPIIFEQMHTKKFEASSWNNTFILLKDNVLLSASSVTTNTDKMEKFLDLVGYDIYFVNQGKEEHEAKWEHCFCLMRSFSDEDAIESDDQDIHLFSCRSLESCICWVTAIRMSKHGILLHQNHETYVRQKIYGNHKMLLESERSKIAMVYSSQVKRSRARKPTESSLIERLSGQLPQTSKSKSRLDLPFYHPEMKPHTATAFLKCHDKVNGVCVIYDTADDHSPFVLSYIVCKRRKPSIIFHVPIIKVNKKGFLIPSKKNPYYTIGGQNQPLFYDLLQLVEFYQLNEGLHTRITHFVGKNGELLALSGKPHQK